MARRIPLKPRKEPKQVRSRQMREDILAASIRVLRREGPLKFTTLRVAEVAGISVGSLYQYFPNKEALIFAIHSRTVQLAWIEVQRILDNPRWSARQKIRLIAQLFFVAESDEVRDMGASLKDTEIFFGDQPEHRAINELVLERFTAFMREQLPPDTSSARIKFNAQLLVTVIESVGKAIAALALPPRAVDEWARTCADMITDHLRLS
jgi:AcrR family transcriptional regulator